MRFLPFVAGALVAFVICATLARRFRFRGHRGVTRTIFIAEFVSSGIPEVIPAIVYDHYKQHSPSKQFDVSPDDSLADVFGRHDEAGLDDDIGDLFQKLRLRYPPDLTLQQWQKPLETVRDVVLWLYWIRQHQPPTDEGSGLGETWGHV